MPRGQRQKEYKKWLEASVDAEKQKVPRTTAWRDKKRREQSETVGEASCTGDSVDDIREQSETVGEALRSGHGAGDELMIPSCSEQREDDSAESDDNTEPESTSSGEVSSDEDYSQVYSEEESSSENNDNPEDPPGDQFPAEDVNREQHATEHLKYSQKYDLDQPVTPSANYTRFEILLIVLHFASRFSLSVIAVKALLELINLILGVTVIPPSHFIFKHIFAPSLKAKYHFYCPKCFLYLNKTDKENFKQCSTCGTRVKMKTTTSSGNFFITFSIEEQIRMKLEHEAQSLLGYKNNRIENPDVIGDIFDGVLYKNLQEEYKLSENDITITLNTDGSPIFKSASNSLWPIQCRINEIDPRDRFSGANLILAGLWFGHSEINMITYLKPVMEELKKLASTGLQWFNAATNAFVTTKVYLLHCAVDTVAKAKVMNMIQFNGRKSCYFCYHPGNPFGEKQIRYDSKIYEERTNEEVRQDMSRALITGKMVKGLKGISALCALVYFNIVHGIIIDYMHSHLLGVGKYMVVNLWTATGYHDRAFYLTKKMIRKIDKRMLAMKPPSDISRPPRPLSQCAHWKATEWRSWILYYGPICLKNILPNPYYNHFLVLSRAIYISTLSEIPKAKLGELEDYLNSFVDGFQDHYGLKHMTYNVHLTRHLRNCVIMSGPLWAYSLFPYESGNGTLVELVNGTSGIAQQIANKFLAMSGLPETLSFHPPVHDAVLSYCDSLMTLSKFKKASKFSEITIIGEKYANPFVPTEQEQLLFHKFKINAENGFFQIRKIILNGFMLALPTKEDNKRDDTVMQMSNNKYAKLEKIFLAANQGEPTDENLFAIVKVIKLRRPDRKSQIKPCQAYAFEDYSIIKPKNIKKKCIFLSCDERNFIVEFPNRFEKD